MKSFILDLIPKLEKYSAKLDDLTFLTNQHWVSIGADNKTKIIYIFRKTGELLISSNGKVIRGNWEYLGNNSILIDIQNQSVLYKHGFLDQDILALKKDNTDGHTIFVNENRFDGELNSIEKISSFLRHKYLSENYKKILETNSKEKEAEYTEIPTDEVKGEVVSNNIIFSAIGMAIFLISLALIVLYIDTNKDQVNFHFFGDRSMCPCTPRITQADPIGDLAVMSIIGFIGLIIFIYQFNKKTK